MSIVLTGLNKRFDHHLVVNNVALEVREGELFVFLGSSGSGKSTILRMIAGLLQPDEGRIEISGKDVTGMSPQQRGVGFVFQNYSLFGHMTVFENVEFGLRIRRVTRQQRRERSSTLLEAVGLTGLGDRYPHQLSGGQQQRVAVARALAYNPEVLLLDEPFGALDVKIRARMRQRLKTVQRELGITAILVTHDQEEAFELGDRIGVVDRGCLLEVGTPEELYHSPKNEFVATFIGGGNVLVGQTRENKFCLGRRCFEIPPEARTAEDNVWRRVLFRPETVELSDTPFAEKQKITTIGQGTITERIFNGATQKLLVQIDDLEGPRLLGPQPTVDRHSIVIEVVMTTRTLEVDFNPGKQVWIGVKNLHYLQYGGMKALVCVTGEGEEWPALECGINLARHGQINMTVLKPERKGHGTQFHHKLEQVFNETDLAHKITVKKNKYFSQDTVITEALAGYYDLIIPEIRKSSGKAIVDYQILMGGTGLPVMLALRNCGTNGRILVCTAAGEPGKTDVRFAGRLARRLKREVTVFHVKKADISGHEEERINQNLSGSIKYLQGLGVMSALKLSEGPALETIIAECKRHEYDMIVIGASFPDKQSSFPGEDLPNRILKESAKAVIVVPMAE